MTRYDVLPAEQRALLPGLTGLREMGYVLYGGTAVALQLGHRRSVDFDFFSDRPMQEDAIRQTAPALLDARTVEQGPRTWTLIAHGTGAGRGVKLSFFGGFTFGRVGEPVLSDGGELALASLADLMGHKLKVLLQRIEAKDYLDIAAMIAAGQSLEHGLGAAQALFPTFSAAEALRALTWFEGADLARVSREQRRLLVSAAEQVSAVPDVPVVSRVLGPAR